MTSARPRTICPSSHSANIPPSSSPNRSQTRIQVDPSFKGRGMISVGKDLVAKNGPGVLMTGFGVCT